MSPNKLPTSVSKRRNIPTKPNFVIVDRSKYKRFLELKKIKDQSRAVLLSDNMKQTRTGKFVTKLNKRKPDEEKLTNITEQIPTGIDKYIDKKSGKLLCNNLREGNNW